MVSVISFPCKAVKLCSGRPHFQQKVGSVHKLNHTENSWYPPRLVPVCTLLHSVPFLLYFLPDINRQSMKTCCYTGVIQHNPGRNNLHLVETPFVYLSFMVTRTNIHSNYRKKRVLEIRARTHRKIKSSLHVLSISRG